MEATNRQQKLSKPSMRVNLIAWDNGVGLRRDMSLLSGCLGGAGIRVSIQRIRRGKLAKWLRPLGLRLQRGAMAMGVTPRFDLNLHLEHIRPEYLDLARCNVLVPNPEWFDARDEQAWSTVDGVLAKTDQALRAFLPMGKPVIECGFTSEDRLDRSVPRIPAFFHLAGRSTAKGTDVLLETWRRHPEWPCLTVLQHPRTAGERVCAPNIVHEIGYLDDARLRLLQNRHLFHLCPSEAEGFGHYLVEALGIGAIVLATDGEPMNELVTPERGILIAPAGQTRQRRGIRYRIEPAGIEQAVERALRLSKVERERMSAAARDFFVRNDRAFSGRLTHALQVLAGGGHGIETVPAASGGG